MSESKHHIYIEIFLDIKLYLYIYIYIQSSMMKGPSILSFPLPDLEASCWWMKTKSVVKRRWASETAACPVASTFRMLNSKRGAVKKEVGASYKILQELQKGSLCSVHFCAWDDGLGVSKCSIDSMSLCASSFAQSMCFVLTSWLLNVS